MGTCTAVAPLTDPVVLLWHRVTRSTQNQCLKNFTLIATTAAPAEKNGQERASYTRAVITLGCLLSNFTQTPPFLLIEMNHNNCMCAMSASVL